jgi:nitrate reductase gamma subunit
MDQTKALALIDQQRRWWRRQDTDLAIARRAERIFFRVALVYLIFAPLLFAAATNPKHHILYTVAGIFLCCGVFLFWRSRRFTQALRVLSDARIEGNGMA